MQKPTDYSFDHRVVHSLKSVDEIKDFVVSRYSSDGWILISDSVASDCKHPDTFYVFFTFAKFDT